MRKKKKNEAGRTIGPRIPRERYERVDRRLARLEQRLGIRELAHAKASSKKPTSDWMTEQELFDLERRMKRIQQKLEVSDDDF